jgi:hypothetical protein
MGAFAAVMLSIQRRVLLTAKSRLSCGDTYSVSHDIEDTRTRALLAARDD